MRATDWSTTRLLNICWVADASLSGAQNWADLVDWADNLVYGGYDDWRLASMSVAAGTPTGSANPVVNCQTDTEQNCRDNELGYMYTYYLPGNNGDDKTENQTVGAVTLTGIQYGYWSGTEFASNPNVVGHLIPREFLRVIRADPTGFVHRFCGCLPSSWPRVDSDDPNGSNRPGRDIAV